MKWQRGGTWDGLRLSSCSFYDVCPCIELSEYELCGTISALDWPRFCSHLSPWNSGCFISYTHHLVQVLQLPPTPISFVGLELSPVFVGPCSICKPESHHPLWCPFQGADSWAEVMLFIRSLPPFLYAGSLSTDASALLCHTLLCCLP